MDDAILKARKACLGYFCDRAARCALYIQRIADTRPIRPWMPAEVGADCHHHQVRTSDKSYRFPRAPMGV